MSRVILIGSTTPSNAYLAHLLRDLDIIEMKLFVVRCLAARYQLNKNRVEFTQMWPLRTLATKLGKNQIDTLRDIVKEGLDHAVAAAKKAQHHGLARRIDHINVPGHRHLGIADVARPYVVFTDHHIAYRGHRNSFWLPHPMLVLGHSHELRLRPYDREESGVEKLAHYANVGAAGRFGNFVPALEIVNGTPNSWSGRVTPQPGRTATPGPQ